MTVEQAAQLNVMVYFDIEFERGLTLREQILELYANQEQWNQLLENNNLYLSENKARDVLNSIMYDQELANLRIIDVCGVKGDGGPVNVFFEDMQNKKAIVLYRGTNGREWYDNAMGFLQSSSMLQRKALSFLNDNLNKYNYVERGYSIEVTGHSKGGNKAQYVTIMNNNVSKCYSFDGQGFSQEFIDDYAEKIKRNSHKIVQSAAHKDFVHPLGYNIAGKTIWYETHKPYDKTLGIDKIPGVSILLAHSPAAMLHFENGKIHMNKEVKQSKLSAELAKKSEQMMKLPKSEKTVYFTSIMAAIQYMHTSTPLMEGDRMPNIKETSRGIAAAVRFLDKTHTSTGLKYVLSSPCLQFSAAIETVLNKVISDKKIGNDIMEVLKNSDVKQLTNNGYYNIYQRNENPLKTFIGRKETDIEGSNILRISQYAQLIESSDILDRGIKAGVLREHETSKDVNYPSVGSTMESIQNYINSIEGGNQSQMGIENEVTKEKESWTRS